MIRADGMIWIYIWTYLCIWYVIYTLQEWNIVTWNVSVIKLHSIISLNAGLLLWICMQHFHQTIDIFLVVIFLGGLLLGATIDQQYYILPDIYAYLLAISGLLYHYIHEADMMVCCELSLLVMIATYVLRKISRNGLGTGDVKWFGALVCWQSPIGSLCMVINSFLLGSLYLIFLYISNKKCDSYIPFGPFICLSSCISFVIPQEWYVWIWRIV